MSSLTSRSTNAPPDAEDGPGKGRPQNTPHEHRCADRSEGHFEFGAHSRAACCLRSGLSEPCPRCCRCWDLRVCAHPEFATYRDAAELVAHG